MKERENRVRIRGVGKLRVRTQSHGKGRTIRRKVMTNGVIGGREFADEIGIDFQTVKRIVAEIRRVTRAGYEVRLGEGEDCVRFYPCLERDFKTMFLAAQTMGDLRTCVGELGFSLVRNGAEAEPEDVREESDAMLNAAAASVTPDTMVTCPTCGERIRVGKSLA